jgi:hypothetical protein
MAALLSKQSGCNKYDPMIFDIPSVESIQSLVFQLVTSCIPVDTYHHLGEPTAIISRIEEGFIQ